MKKRRQLSKNLLPALSWRWRRHSQLALYLAAVRRRFFIFSSTFKKKKTGKTAAVVCTKKTVGNKKDTELLRNVLFSKEKEKP